jgi:hypothetical protein
MMIKRRRPLTLHHSTPLKIFELLLMVCVLFGLGAWQMYTGWKHPDHVGWMTSGAIFITGMVACAGLIWHRRGTTYSVVAPLLFTMQLANFAEGILKWRAKEEGATWPAIPCILGLVLLALIIWEERNRRKEAARDATLESKFFDMEDRL